MEKKKTFALRVDAQLLNAVERWAADEFRSANGQLEWIIREMLKQKGPISTPNNNKKYKNLNRLLIICPKRSNYCYCQ
jgi:hypothetical protein